MTTAAPPSANIVVTPRSSTRRRSETVQQQIAAALTPEAATVTRQHSVQDPDSHRAWKRTVLSVFGIAAGHKHANLFYKPVSDEHAPFYSKLIKKYDVII